MAFRKKDHRTASVVGQQQVARVRSAAGSSGYLLPVVWGFGLVLLVLLLVWQRLRVVQLGYVLSATSKVQRKLEQENRELKLELATLTAPDRLENMARRRLGLKDPEKGQVVVLP